jgi:ATP-dependent DNA helicase PIF1
MSIDINEDFERALSLMEAGKTHLFITGKAGSGKSTLLNYFCENSSKKPVVLAPTGVAALNVRGQTIHRFFNFPIDVTVEKIRTKKSKPRDAKIYKKLKCLIIDEISMVRADILDCIDEFLRLYGPLPSQYFGGVQMIFVGDLYQLPPVVGREEQHIFETLYETPYFFSSEVMKNVPLEIIGLQKIYRQKDPEFVTLLNRIRGNTVDEDDMVHLNKRHVKKVASKEFQITLSTTNAAADSINEHELAALDGKIQTVNATVNGTFTKEYYPTATDLSFKKGAQIMLLNNDQQQRWVNGSIGVIESYKKDAEGKPFVGVRLQDNERLVYVYPHTWEVVKFGLTDGAIVSENAGTFTQYPFRLAWAVTIHKSQGKTFDNVVVDIGRGTFAAGQVYVALSRCTSFEGITLTTPILKSHIRTDKRITDFFRAYLRAKDA